MTCFEPSTLDTSLGLPALMTHVTHVTRFLYISAPYAHLYVRIEEPRAYAYTHMANEPEKTRHASPNDLALLRERS